MASSGPIDEDTARTINRGRETVGVALGAAQERLQRVFIVFVVGMLGGIVLMRSIVWPQLKQDLLVQRASVIAQTPFDVLLLQVKIGLLVGVLLAIPVLLYYMRDPLRDRGILRDVPVSRWKAVLVAAFALALFLGGAVYAYYLFFPLMFSFLATNAVSAGLAPTYSIVHWTQFILVLGLSFGLAAQMPLVMTALSYSGVVPYETFRDKWKIAVVLIFTFGAVFSPPDPFTQILWAAPLVMLYGFSLYLSKVVVTAKRGSQQVDFMAEMRDKWHIFTGTGLAAFALTYWGISAGVGVYINDQVIPAIPASVRPPLIPTVQEIWNVPRPQALLLTSVAVAVVMVALVMMYYVYLCIEAAADMEAGVGPGGDPSDIDLGALDAEGVRSAPPEAFADLSEEEAVGHANRAMDDDRPEAARAILDRFDEAEAEREAVEESGEGAEAVPEGAAAEAVGDAPEEGNVFSRTAAGMADAFTEEETTEDDIGGYYHDIRFILGSLRSRAFRIVGVFMLVLAATFYFLYAEGIGLIREDFISRVPAEVRPEGPVDWPITLHPVEALVFEVKISTIFAAIVTLPLVLYYAWPALSSRGVVTGDRRTVLVWGGSVLIGLLVGSAVGYLFVAPAVISWLVADALRANMVIAYRVSDFFWLVFITTAGIGLLVDIPVTMLLFYAGRIVRYRTMRDRWRVPTIGAFVFGALVTPDSLWTMMLIALPIVAFYFLGLGVLWVVTLGGRRERSRLGRQSASD